MVLFIICPMMRLMQQSSTLTLGVYWEKRLSGAQRRYTRAKLIFDNAPNLLLRAIYTCLISDFEQGMPESAAMAIKLSSDPPG